MGAGIILSFFLISDPVSPDRKYDTRSGEIAGNVLKHVNRHYIDKSKIDYEEMLERAVSGLEVALDDVLVIFPEDGDEFTVKVKDKIKKFQGKVPSSSRELENTLGKAMSFALSGTDAGKDRLKNIEYSIVDSMLKALDPHSVMIPPDIYKEFLVDTEGSFGGLGIVVGIRDGELTVISPIEGSPAHRAGIKTKDRIVQIENESTVNMPLLEAVGKLRGKKGTTVNILVSRENSSKPLGFSITRNIIKIKSVEGFDLENGLLYLRIRNFQKNTFADLRKEVRKRHGLRGIILDLRGNPGGLLSQAEYMADFFLSSGTIITTKGRDHSNVRRASSKQPEYRGKVIVLIDQGSASASEIVAGALKNNDRALVIGNRSFGKGTVQKIFDFDEGGALKLTVADYLTPGNISIQDRGVTPNILVQRSLVTEDKIVYNPLPEKKKNVESAELMPANLILKHIAQTPDSVEKEEETPPDESLTKEQKLEKISKDFHVNLAVRLLESSNTGEMIEIARGFAEDHLEKIWAKIEETGVDWSYGETKNPLLSVETIPSEMVFRSWAENTLKVKVTNVGKNPIYRLSAVTDCENPAYRDGELLFGKLLPGKSKTAKIRFSPHVATTTREDVIKLVFTNSDGGGSMPEETLLVKTVAEELPDYSYNYEVVDDGRFGSDGNGNGFAEHQETIVVDVRLKNVGPGISKKTVAALKNLSGADVFLEKGRFEFEDFAPGETRRAPFRFRQSEKGESAEFELIVMDEDFRELKTHKIVLPLMPDGKPFIALPKVAVFKSRTKILGGRFEGAQIVGSAHRNSRVNVLGTSDKWIRVEGKNSVTGWVPEKNLRIGPTGGSQREISPLDEVFETPPSVTLSKFPLSTGAPEVTIEGSVSGRNSIESVAVWQKGDKIRLFTPGRKNAPVLFSLNLEEGMNLFTIIAKDKKGMTSRKTLAIRRNSSIFPGSARVDGLKILN